MGRLLLSQDDVDPDFVANTRQIALAWATRQRLIDVEGRTLLLWANVKGEEAIVKLLLEASGQA